MNAVSNMKDFERQVVISGIGWIIAGILCFSVYTLQTQQVCNCPNIPVNISAQQAQTVCNCPSGNLYTLLVGILTVVVGAWIIISRKRILKLKKKLERRS